MIERKAVDVVCLDFSKAFGTVSHSIVLGKLAAHSLDRYILCWAKNWPTEWGGMRFNLAGNCP